MDINDFAKQGLAAQRAVDYRLWPLIEIRSGGQTGVDQAGLRAAKELGYKTGGIAPKNFRTEQGPAPWLATEYGVVDSDDASYALRTAANIHDCDATLIVAMDVESPGTIQTIKECRRQHKPRLLVEILSTADYSSTVSFDTLHAWVITNNVRILNVAGNRESKAPGIGQFVYEWLLVALAR